MALEFKLPDVGEGIHEGVLVEWMVAEGDTVEADQPFVKVETDKAIVELPAPEKSTVGKLHFKKGDTVHVGDVLITFGEVGPAVEKAAGAAPEKNGKPPEKELKPALEPAPAREKPSVSEGKSPGRRVPATPHTRAYARKMGVDIESVKGSGRGGRVTDEDVDRALKDAPGTPPVKEQTVEKPALSPVTRTAAESRTETTGEGEVERVKVTHLRKVIADNMIRSKHTAAHVTHVDEADVTELYSRYKNAKAQIEKAEGIKFTIMPFFVKALVVALKAHPWLNAQYDEVSQEILLKKFYNIGIAVDTPEGLMVPVVKAADRKDMVKIAVEIADLAARAQERKLTLGELQEGTFTITNVGRIGGLFATPVIRYPEVAIMGLHAMKERPVVHNGEIAIRKIINISLSFDHRVVDGMVAARFMTDLVQLLENPDLLMMRLV